MGGRGARRRGCGQALRPLPSAAASRSSVSCASNADAPSSSSRAPSRTRATSACRSSGVTISWSGRRSSRRGCRLELPATTIVTADEVWEETARLEPGQESQWPHARLRAGGTVDLRDVPGPEAGEPRRPLRRRLLRRGGERRQPAARPELPPALGRGGLPVGRALAAVRGRARSVAGGFVRARCRAVDVAALPGAGGRGRRGDLARAGRVAVDDRGRGDRIERRCLTGSPSASIETTPDSRAARADLPRQHVPDDPPLDARDAGRHRGGRRRRGLRGRRGRRPARDRRGSSTRRSRPSCSARTPSRSSAAGSWRVPPPSTSSATAGSGSSRPPASTRRSGTRSARRSARRSGGSGVATASRMPMIAIAGYHDSPLTIAEEVAELKELGLAGMKLKVGSLEPRGRRGARPRGACGRRATTSSSPPTRNQEWTREEAVRFARLVEDAGARLARGAVPLGQRPALRCATSARGARRAGLRGPERVLGRGLPRPDGRGRDRRLQLRLLLVGRPDRVAARRGGGAHARRRDGPPRGAAGREPPARVDPARHLRRVLPPRPRPDLVEPRREPAAARRRDDRAHRTRPGSAGSSTSSTWRPTPLPEPSSRDAHPLDHLVVELDAETGAGRHLRACRRAARTALRGCRSRAASRRPRTPTRWAGRGSRRSGATPRRARRSRSSGARSRPSGCARARRSGARR